MSARLVLLAALSLPACVTHSVCPATKEARAAIVNDLMARYQCSDYQQVEGTIEAISDWKCKLHEELTQALPDQGATAAKNDCLLIAMKLEILLAEGTPSAWQCVKLKLSEPFDRVCEQLGAVSEGL